MARRPKMRKSVETLTHEEATRTNIPTAEYRSVMEKEQQDPFRVAYERHNRALDPRLVWRGKDEQGCSDLVGQAPPLFVQQEVRSKMQVDDLLRRTAAGEKASDLQPDLFTDSSCRPDKDAATESYRYNVSPKECLYASVSSGVPR